MHEKAGPGKLTDFVPESERNAAARAAEEEKKGKVTARGQLASMQGIFSIYRFLSASRILLPSCY